jgi:hypothetical protein
MKPAAFYHPKDGRPHWSHTLANGPLGYPVRGVVFAAPDPVPVQVAEKAEACRIAHLVP